MSSNKWLHWVTFLYCMQNRSDSEEDAYGHTETTLDGLLEKDAKFKEDTKDFEKKLTLQHYCIKSTFAQMSRSNESLIGSDNEYHEIAQSESGCSAESPSSSSCVTGFESFSMPASTS